MKLIPLFAGTKRKHNHTFTGLNALVDDEDYERVAQHNWYLHDGYPVAHVKLDGVWTRLRLHWFVLKINGIMIDHKDRVPLNCQKSNLRECTKAQNSWNRPKDKRRNAKSKYKGVQWKPTSITNASRGRWMARIYADNHNYHLGYFDDEHTAAVMYDFWATLLHGDFSCTNFAFVSSSEKPVGGLSCQTITRQSEASPCPPSSGGSV